MGIHDRDYYQPELRPLRPWDNKSMVTLLIIANLVVFVANYLFTSGTEAIANALTLYSDSIKKPLEWYKLITYGFTHTAMFHILGNLLSLYFLGRQVEEKYGKWEFFRIYMLSLLVCGLGWSLLRISNGDSMSAVIGASGAVTTVSMLFVFSFPMAELLLYGIIPIRAWMLGAMLIVFNVFGGQEFVAYDVHLIGIAFAAAYFYGNWNFGFMENVVGTFQTKMGAKRRGLKVLRPDEDEPGKLSRDEQEADRILEKIHSTGKDSLTKREQAFLEKYSKKVREQRK